MAGDEVGRGYPASLASDTCWVFGSMSERGVSTSLGCRGAGEQRKPVEASLNRNMGVGWSGQYISMCEVVGSLWT